MRREVERSSPYSMESERVVPRSRSGLAWGASCSCWVNTVPGGPSWRARRYASYPGPTTDQQRHFGRAASPSGRCHAARHLGTRGRQDPPDRVDLRDLRDLRSHASVLPELVSFVGIGIKRVRAGMLLQVRMDNARAIPVHSLNTVAGSTRRSSRASPGGAVDGNAG
jgi:hypothetical protein